MRTAYLSRHLSAIVSMALNHGAFEPFKDQAFGSLTAPGESFVAYINVLVSFGLDNLFPDTPAAVGSMNYLFPSKTLKITYPKCGED